MAARRLLVCCSALLLAGCGSHAAKPCESPAQVKALERLDADLASLKQAAKQPTPDTLKGSKAVSRLTDRFLIHVLTAPIDPLVRNRMIDHAAAIVAPVCQQCFQALEAERPIPGIAHTHTGEACRAESLAGVPRADSVR
jgi:hypothetical protein